MEENVDATKMDMRLIISQAHEKIPQPQGLHSVSSELIMVRLTMKPDPDGISSEHKNMMRGGDVYKYVEATLELHYEPGVNPYNMLKAATVWKIELTRLDSPQVFWFTTPGLHNEVPDEAGRTWQLGAAVIDWNWAHAQTIWRHPDCIRYESAMGGNDDRRECDLELLPRCGTCYGLKDDDQEFPLHADAHCICPASEPAADQQA